MVRAMRIMFLNKAPKNAAIYDPTEIEKLLNSYASPGTNVEIGFPENFEGSRVEQVMGEQMMLNGLDHMLELPALIRKIAWAAENGYDAVIQSNTFDPGVDGGRLTVGIPVLGPFRTTLHIATNLADKIGIIVPLESHVPYTWRLLRSYGMESFVTDIRALGVYGTKLKEQREAITIKAAKMIEDLVRDTRAQSVIPLGGALIPYIVDPAELQRRTGVHVYNTKSVTIRVAELCVGLGLTHSPLTYPRAKLAFSDFSTLA
jgi:Asp/Glu/hydantoin racemase